MNKKAIESLKNSSEKTRNFNQIYMNVTAYFGKLINTNKYTLKDAEIIFLMFVENFIINQVALRKGSVDSITVEDVREYLNKIHDTLNDTLETTLKNMHDGNYFKAEDLMNG